MQPLAHVLVLTIGLVLLGTPASAVVLSPGDIVVSLPTNEIGRIDPTTGGSELLASGSTCSAMAGLSVELVALEASGNVLAVTTGASNSIIRIDPADGSCSVVAGNGVGGTTFSGLVEGIVVVSAAQTMGASAISDWGIALVVGILLGLSFRLGRRSAARMA